MIEPILKSQGKVTARLRQGSGGQPPLKLRLASRSFSGGWCRGAELNRRHTDFQSELSNPLSVVNACFINPLPLRQLWVSLDFVWWFWVLAGKVTGKVKSYGNQISYCRLNGKLQLKTDVS